ncbi:MAG: hypothetical protein A3G75_09330 [Verrucomicrobia bacterium RIFCSPLOWO2_12_FULL_64_8]|nr:MAG: hypothetical protein A3G75_09330 [Verrucomicrobia bacterium RIFCSPLOWO2_12_FULL_64_8]
MFRRLTPLVTLATLLIDGQQVFVAAEWSNLTRNHNWTNGANWVGGTAPPNDGTADVLFPASGWLHFVTLDASQSLNSLTVGEDDSNAYYLFSVTGGASLTIGSGGIIVPAYQGDSWHIFDSTFTLNAGAAQSWNVGSSSDLVINGTITGGGDLDKSGAGNLFLYGNNTLSGSFTLSNGGLILGHANALGTGTLTIDGGDFTPFIDADVDSLTIANPVNLNGSVDLASRPNSSLTFTGAVNLGSSPDLFVTGTVVFTGSLSETGGPRTIFATGPGTLRFSGANSTTGGAWSNAGALVFASPAALPSSGSFTVVAPGYLGAAVSSNVQSGFLDRFDKPNSDGTVGFDEGVTVAGAIDLTGFHSSARLGSATSATLAGTITPQANAYQFGGGGGVLRINSNLTDAPGPTAQSVEVMSPSGRELTLVLAGANTFSGGITVDKSLLRFANSGAFPATGNIIIPEGSTGYAGFDYNVDLSTSTLSTAFSSRYSISSASLVLGFDSPGVSSIPGTIDLSGFDLTANPYLGTTTALTLSGTIIPAGGAGAPYRFAPVKGGTLTVDSTLTGTRSVEIGTGAGGIWEDGTTVLTAGNSHSGGTVLRSGRLDLANAGALGTGGLTIQDDAELQASSGLTISNSILVDTSEVVRFGGANSFTLSGALSSFNGSFYNQAFLVKNGAGTLTLTGDNFDLLSDIELAAGGLAFAHDNAAGFSLLYVADGATASFTTSNPAIKGLFGAAGATVDLASGTTLEINQESSNFDLADGGISFSYSGTITGGGGLHKAGTDNLWLTGASSYSSGTTIDSGVVIVGHNNALGTGTVFLSTTSAGILLQEGVTLANSLSFSSGLLGGFGDFAPAGGVDIGAGRIVSPGSDLGDFVPVGVLGFATGLTFGPGGVYIFDISGQSPAHGDLINVAGTLTITSTPGSPFLLGIYAVDLFSYSASLPDFDPNTQYQWTVLTASGGITGFAASNFLIDSSAFVGSTGLPNSTFTLNQIGNDLVLNFSPVPEPSTYALMSGGLLALLAGHLRRRHSHRLAAR